MRAFDAATGRQLWYSHELGIGNGTEDASNVAATSGAVYFSQYPNAVYGGDNARIENPGGNRLELQRRTLRDRIANPA